MNITYSSVRDPRWATPDHSAILCIVKFAHIKPEVPFTAMPSDVMPHGRIIFEDCVSGKYGPVTEFEPAHPHGPTIPPASEPQLPLFEQWPEMLQFLEEANRENSAGTVRGQVLVWASMIELLIGRLVHTFLVDHKITTKLLNDSLSTFSAQTDLAFSMGLISKSEHRKCNRIREIRNHAAHSWSISLENQKVKSAFLSLYDSDHSDYFEWIEDIDFLVRLIYAGSASEVALRLAERQSAATNAKRAIQQDETS